MGAPRLTVMLEAGDSQRNPSNGVADDRVLWYVSGRQVGTVRMAGVLFF
jgi:hypothetical protein